MKRVNKSTSNMSIRLFKIKNQKALKSFKLPAEERLIKIKKKMIMKKLGIMILTKSQSLKFSIRK